MFIYWNGAGCFGYFNYRRFSVPNRMPNTVGCKPEEPGSEVAFFSIVYVIFDTWNNGIIDEECYLRLVDLYDTKRVF